MPEQPNQEQSGTANNAETRDESAEYHREQERRHWRFERWFGGFALFLTLVAAVGAVASAWAAFRALTASQNAVSEARRAADEAKRQADAGVSQMNLAKRAELSAPFQTWKIVSFDAGKSPIISFEFRNAGTSHAHILSATYEYAIANGNPTNFTGPQDLDGSPALIGPDEKSGPIIVAGLPTLDSDVQRDIEAGRQFIYLRIRAFYQNVFGDVVELRVTGRYGGMVNEAGEIKARFVFPDTNVPENRWGTGFEGIRPFNDLRGLKNNKPTQ